MSGERSIAKTYEKFFSKDPLLFDVDNQKDYCNKVLNNILGQRTTTSSRPEDLDLYHEESRAKFERPKPRRFTKPSPDAARAYRRAYLKRVEVPAKYKRKLQKITMLTDGSRTSKRVTNEFKEHDYARAQLKKRARVRKTVKSTLEKRLRIAAIGYRVRISKLQDNALLGEELCLLTPVNDVAVCETLREQTGIRELGRTRAVAGADLARWTETISGYIEHAHRRQSHIIVLPEFGLPPAYEGITDELEAHLQNLCKKAAGGHFLFSGSRHEGAYNRGLIFQKKRRADVPKPHWHFKTASARNLGENILGPHHNKIPSTTSSIALKDVPPLNLAIAVAICYDAFDPSAFLNLVQQGLKHRREQWVSVILVPSFNPSDDFVALLRDLSFVTQSIVVYVDGLHGNAKMFICGFAVSDFAERKPFIQNEIRSRLKFYHARQTSIQQQMKELRQQNTLYRRHKRELDSITRRILALQDLEQALSGLEISGGLEHIITVESCPDCKKKGHRQLGRCERDVLYYNLDPRLIIALQKYRRDYVDDLDLPTSLRN